MLERTILLDGFSKTFAMTGWRLGYAAVPSGWSSRSLGCHQLGLLHRAGRPARGRRRAHRARDEVNAMLEEFRRRRDPVVAGLNALPASPA